MQGFISIHRKIMDNPVWNDPNYLKLWIYCLLKASHKDHEQLVGNKVVELKRGQFVTGRTSLAEDMNKGVKKAQRLSEKTWERYLKNLEKWQMLTIKPTNKLSVVSIVNYDVYQDVFNKPDQQTDQQLTSNCPATDQQLTTNNNGNKGNNENKKDTTTAAEDPIPFFEKNFHMLNSPWQREQLVMMCNENSDELVLAAMKLALEKNRKNLSTVEGILRIWRENKVKTLDQARAHETEYRNNQKQSYSKKPYKPQGNTRRDKLPKHMTEKPEVNDEPVTEEEQQELDRWLKSI